MFFFRPRPKYRVGALLRLDVVNPRHQHMIVHNRRWICPNGEATKRWVYDGPIVCGHGTEVVIITYVSCVSEGDLTPALSLYELDNKSAA